MNAKGSFGWTPFMNADINGHKDVVKPLQKIFSAGNSTIFTLTKCIFDDFSSFNKSKNTFALQSVILEFS